MTLGPDIDLAGVDPNSVHRSSRVGLVTVTFNSAQVIDAFLSSVFAQSHDDLRLYVVDNASQDRTLERIRLRNKPNIILIQNSHNCGFAEANNQGTRAALDEDCEFILFINNDTEFPPNLVVALLDSMRRTRCQMATPKIVFYDTPDVIWSAGGGFNPLKGYAGFHFGLHEMDRGQYDEEKIVDHAPACCLLIRREVFSRIGLMDETYFAYHDDTDFCYRAKRAGMNIVYCPSVTLVHKASSLTGGEDSVFSVRFRTRNQIYFMLKNLGFWRGVWYLPAFQCFLFFKLVSGRIGVDGFLLRQRAFWEGLQVWRQVALSRKPL